MKVFNLATFAESTLPEGAALALGNFDGVHSGHRALLDEAKKSCPSAVFTFEKIAKKAPVEILSDTEEKLRLFAEYGIDFAVIEDFEKVKDLSCEEFVFDYLKNLNIKKVVCGYNYKFGKNASGDAAMLSELCEKRGIDTAVVNKVCVEGVEVSSSIIRSLIKEGKVDTAKKLLGHPYALTSKVVHGKHLAEKYNLPTANQTFKENSVVPLNGVYATRVHIDTKVFSGATNVGMRPTVDDGEKVNAETHIIGFDGDLYGRIIRTEFIKKIRDEIKFSSEEELFSQIKKDISKCSAVFSELSESERKARFDN